MTDQASPCWNRHLLPIDEAHQTLEKASFRLQLPDGCWGTGFFISKDGWALTADHNLRNYRRVHFIAHYKGKELKFRYHRDSSSQHADIALMKVAQELPADLDVDYLTVVFLDPKFPKRVRIDYFRGKQVCVFGYPVRGTRLETWFIDGTINATDPISKSLEGTSGSRSAQVIECERLRIIGTGTDTRLGGISGAAVFDQEIRSVIAVQGAQSRLRFEIGNVRASEIAQLVDRFPELVNQTGAFHPIFKASAEGLPERGIAALTRQLGASIPVIVPISVRFMPSEMPSGNLTFENEDLNRLAQEAVFWAGEYG